ncbi:hypothetical protein AXY_22640 [Amphibacillus xylanus NBRC 15112]|uniref:Uncharacterized protein n=1 Tax=Amphibacillus xylanus (strain ATCC 51415 / DSM 6626 / JCM 7361 / LMG 17667 / NBRC 15112 / Ep01) TaxID=698758 RepID=K0J5S4_AMPXN|nr:hypothetical protein AXY_22640 [Amphibacillus xylanus NBRC 15112]
MDNSAVSNSATFENSEPLSKVIVLKVFGLLSITDWQSSKMVWLLESFSLSAKA